MEQEYIFGRSRHVGGWTIFFSNAVDELINAVEYMEIPEVEIVYIGGEAVVREVNRWWQKDEG